MISTVAHHAVGFAFDRSHFQAATQDVLFATHRQQLAGGPARFGVQLGELAFGLCRVPNSAKKPKAEQEVFLSSVEAASVALETKCARLDRPHICVFVHGYANTFDDACARGASLQMRLPGAIVVTYSWPSWGSVFRYKTDRSRLDEFSEGLHSFLSDWLHPVAQRNGAAVSLVAHSMGCELTHRSLALATTRKSRLRLNNAVFAAADVGVGLCTQFVSVASGLCERLTIYGHEDDRSLSISAGVNGEPRIGDFSYPLHRSAAADWINLSDLAEGTMKHAEAFQHAAALADLRELLQDGKVASERARLRPEPEDSNGTVRYALIREETEFPLF